MLRGPAPGAWYRTARARPGFAVAHSCHAGADCVGMRTPAPLTTHVRTLAFLALVIGTAGPVAAAAATAPKAMTEEQKIQALIEHVRGLGDRAVMIRNGSEHSAKEAAEHMAAKRKRAGDKVKTAREFITLCAAKSSATGKPYQIRFKDG